MKQLFSHPKQLFILTLLNSTLTGIRAEDNAYSCKVGIKTAKAFKLPYTMTIDKIGKVILESVNSKDNRNGVEVPASVEIVTKDGKKDFSTTPVIAKIIPSSFEAYMTIMNAQIAGLTERIEYLQKQSAPAIQIPAVVGNGVPLTPISLPEESQPEVTAKADDLPF